MPTIVFVSPKGGAGKTTAALLLASQLASSYDVTLIDSDPNRPIKAWASGGNTPKRLSVVSDVDEDNIIERIEEAAQQSPIVVVDLAELTFMDSTGLSALVVAKNRMESDGDVLMLTRPRPNVRRVLEITGLADWVGEWSSEWSEPTDADT